MILVCKYVFLIDLDFLEFYFAIFAIRKFLSGEKEKSCRRLYHLKFANASDSDSAFHWNVSFRTCYLVDEYFAIGKKGAL